MDKRINSAGVEAAATTCVEGLKSDSDLYEWVEQRATKARPEDFMTPKTLATVCDGLPIPPEGFRHILENAPEVDLRVAKAEAQPLLP
jgi:hypothetical protein